MNIPKLTLSKENTLIVFSCFCLALVFSAIPWEYFRYQAYSDRKVYINYIDVHLNKVYWFDFSGLPNKIFNEWGWHYFIDYLNSELNFNSGIILFLISLFLLTISFVIVSSSRRIYLCFLLLNPLYIDFFYSQARLSFAITLIYCSIIVYYKNKYLSIFFLLPSLFIHTSSFIFILIFYSAMFLTENSFISQRKKFVISFIIGAFVALITGPFMSIILSSFDDRRAVYGDFSSPILYMSYWLGLFLFIISKCFQRNTNKLNKYYFYISLSILTIVLFSTFLNGYPSRFIAASFPFLILALSDFRRKSDFLVGVLYVMYTIILWFFWLT